MRLLVWLPLLTAIAVTAAEPLGSLPGPGLYSRLVEPRDYPAYTRRAFEVPSWSTFDGRPQLVGGRYVPFTRQLPSELLTDCPADAPLADRPWLVGRVYRPDQGILRTPEPAFSDALRHQREIGLYLFNVGGYGPGSPLRGSFGQCQVTPAQSEALTGLLGDRWLGFDLGEQDGRYHNGFEALQLPAPRDAASAHRAFRRWCDRVVDDQGGRLTLLSTLWGWHYPVQDGAMGLFGAECQNKFGVTNPQVQYTFLRGAGKQYGVLWYGDASIFSTFGLTRWTLDQSGGLVALPGGSSANLLRRIFMSQLLWNCAILGFEGATTAQAKDQPSRLSPLGVVQVGAERLLQRGFTPGVMQTPVAILQDYLSGWMPARTNCVQFTAFNSLPYRPGDHLTDQLLSLLFPGYEDCGWYFDERGAMAPTPYGDVADSLLSDAPAQVLSCYSLVLASGIETDPRGVRDRLDAYLATGGTVMAVGDDGARLWPEYCLPATSLVPAGADVRWADGAIDHEPNEFAVHAAALPAGARVLATCGERPAVVRIPRRGGTLLLLLSSTGLNHHALPAKPGGHPMWGGENTGLERPFRLLAHATRAYDAALASQRLFTAGDGLTVTTCRRPDGTFVVGASNPSLARRPFALTSHVGPVAQIREVDLGATISSLPGYWPHRWSRFLLQPTQHRDDEGELTGETTASAAEIGGGDIRLLEVTLKACSAKPRPDLRLPAASRGRRLRVPDLFTLPSRLLDSPNFGDTYDGVAVTVHSLRDTDPTWLAEQAPWYRRHGLKISLIGTDAPAAQRAALGDCAEPLTAATRLDDGDSPGPALPTAAAAKSAPYLALHDLFDPALAVAQRPGLLERFGGLMLDGDWLAARGRTALARDAGWLSTRGLGVVVDFSRLLNRFPDLTFASGVPHRYAASVRILDDCLAKMAQVGWGRAVICSHANAETVDDWADQRRGIERFLGQAASAGVTVHWRTCARRPPGKLADHVALVADLQRTHRNLRIAACTVDEPEAERLASALAPAGRADLWLLAAPAPQGGRPGVQFMPLTGLRGAQVGKLLTAASGATVVFDADYLSWSEVLADVAHVDRASADPRPRP